MSEEELKYWLLFHHAPGIGPVRFSEILAHFGDLETAYRQRKDLIHQGILPEKTAAYFTSPDWEAITREIQWQTQAQNHILTLESAEYPELLREIPDPPPVLYAMGNTSLLRHPQIAIVGSRNPSRSGRENALRFARFLGNNGFTITSGLALGVDTAAHEGALDTLGSTIAVTGTGLDRVYPARNRALAHEIIEKNGLLLSEYPLQTPPMRVNFPRRNRIISGLTLGTLVVEAAQKSGSLITARTAGEQGREIFAIPGSIHNPLAKGCHQLIRQGAKLVETAEHIVEELGHMVKWEREAPKKNDNSPPLDLPVEAVELLNELGFEPASIDTLVERSGLTPESVSSMLLVLELQGCVESLPGGAYARIN